MRATAWSLMNGARAISLLMILGVSACKKPSPPSPTPNSAQPQPVVASADAGRDPCSILTAEQRSMVVAKVGARALTLCEFVQQVQSQDQYLRQRLNAPEPRRSVLNAWVDSELLAEEARARGFDKQVEVRRAIVSKLARELEDRVRAEVPAPTVTDADISKYYLDHESDYATPENVRASQIVLADRASAERVLGLAREHGADDAYWRELAKNESVDPVGRDTGGDLGFFAKEGSPIVAKEVAAAAFALNAIGEVAPTVVESEHGGPRMSRGYHVVRFISRRAAIQHPLEEVRAQIQDYLWHDKLVQAQDAAVNALLERLRTTTTVTIDEGALAGVQVKAPPPGTPPAMMAPPSNFVSPRAPGMP